MSAADTEDGLATLVYHGVIATCVAPLVDAVLREYRLSPKVVWGNVASALGGAATVVGKARPELSGRAMDLADRLLRKGSLVGTGGFVRSDVGCPEPYFMRNNCCLFHRIPGGGTCADCVLVTRR
jgi:ferric iron reductase protein FhuF